MSKKIILIIGIVIVIGLAIFWVTSIQSRTSPGGDSAVGFSIRDFMPFGSSNNNSDLNNSNNQTGGQTDLGNNPDNQETNSKDLIIAKLRKISNEPVAGAVIFNSGTTSVVRFVEKGTGNVYEASSNSNSVTRLTNTTIPKIVRAFWLNDGSGFLAQTIDSTQSVVETSFVRISKPVNNLGSENLTPYTTTISKLQTDIEELIINEKNNKILYYIINQNGSVWYVSNPDGTERQMILSHPLTEWSPKIFSDNTAIAQTKSSASSLDYVFLIDIKTKTLRRVGSASPGLSVLPNYSLSPYLISEGGSSLGLYITDEETWRKFNTNMRTLADKCVWTKNKPIAVFCGVPENLDVATYPDDWYKGKVSTRDSILKIDYINGVYSNISDLSSESNQRIDVYEPKISNDDSHLIFKNKIDGFLWLLRLN